MPRPPLPSRASRAFPDSSRPRPMEIACGLVIDVEPEAPRLARSACRHPREAINRVILGALRRPPCVVSFSGGRDSAAMLAVATALARAGGACVAGSCHPSIPGRARHPGGRLAGGADPPPPAARLGAPDRVRTSWTRSAQWRKRSCGATACCGRSTRISTCRCSNSPRAARSSPGSAATNCWVASAGRRRRRCSPGACASGPAICERSAWPSPLDRFGAEPWPAATRSAGRGCTRTSDRGDQPAACRVEGPDAAAVVSRGRVTGGAAAGASCCRTPWSSWRTTPKPYWCSPFSSRQCSPRRRSSYGIRGPVSRADAMRELFGDVLPETVSARRSKATFDQAFFADHSRSFAGTLDRRRHRHVAHRC